jgi:hypothetical protein
MYCRSWLCAVIFVTSLSPAVFAPNGVTPAKAPAAAASAAKPPALPSAFSDLSDGAEAMISQANATADDLPSQLKDSLAAQQDAKSRLVEARKDLAAHLPPARAALSALKRGAKAKPPTVSAAALASAKSEFEACAELADRVDGAEHELSANVLAASVALDGDDEFAGLKGPLKSAESSLANLATRANQLPSSVRPQGLARVAALRKELDKGKAGYTAGNATLRQITTARSSVGPSTIATTQREIATALNDIDVLSKAGKGPDACGLQKVDWKSFRYPDGPMTLALKNGTGKAMWGAVQFSDAVYGDLNGDGQLDALVTVSELPPSTGPDEGNALCNWEGKSRTYAFAADTSCAPRSLGSFDQSTSSSRKFSDKALIVDEPYFTGAANEPRCVPSGLKRFKWSLVDGKLKSTTLKAR